MGTKKRKGVIFRLRGKPQKPKRKMIKYERELAGESVADLLEIVESHGGDPEKATIECGYDWEGYGEAKLVFTYNESENDFSDRVATYERKLAAWNEWYTENQEAIEAELSRRERLERARIAAAEEKAQRRTAKEIKALEKQLKAMKKSLGGESGKTR